MMMTSWKQESAMRQGISVLAALAATLAGVPAAAETAPDRMALMEWGYVLAGNRPSGAPIAILNRPLCLLVAAEDQGFAAKVGRRVVSNAREAGIDAKRGKCRPNAAIVFAEDAHGQLSELREERGRVYGSIYAAQLTRMLAQERDGFAFQLDDFNGIADRFGPGPERSALAGTLVVIDRAAAEGLDPVQLADYATLRLLAPTGDLATLTARGDTAPASTILTLFRDRQEAPARMTRFDRAYLQSLYKLPQGTAARRIMARASQLALTDTGTVDIDTGRGR
jgi:hypothetical protein